MQYPTTDVFGTVFEVLNSHQVRLGDKISYFEDMKHTKSKIYIRLGVVIITKYSSNKDGRGC